LHPRLHGFELWAIAVDPRVPALVRLDDESGLRPAPLARRLKVSSRTIVRRYEV
jgi:hypothetical protein